MVAVFLGPFHNPYPSSLMDGWQLLSTVGGSLDVTPSFIHLLFCFSSSDHSSVGITVIKVSYFETFGINSVPC